MTLSSQELLSFQSYNQSVSNVLKISSLSVGVSHFGEEARSAHKKNNRAVTSTSSAPSVQLISFILWKKKSSISFWQLMYHLISGKTIILPERAEITRSVISTPENRPIDYIYNLFTLLWNVTRTPFQQSGVVSENSKYGSNLNLRYTLDSRLTIYNHHL